MNDAAGNPVQLRYPTRFPFAESPFVELELEARSDLTAAQADLVRQFSRQGFCVLPGAAADDLITRIRGEVGGLFNPDVAEGPASFYRRQDAWKESPAVRELATAPAILDSLRLLYGREPVPFQTLNFLYGTQQAPHSDAVLFNTLPPRFMCGVWVALEDIPVESGPLFYYPGSHRLPQYYPDDLNTRNENPDDFMAFTYSPFVRILLEANGYEKAVFSARKGDALVWASNLVHGGMRRLDQSLTRWSQVTHYFFRDCVCYVPLYSNPVAGEFRLREVTDFATGQPIEQTYDGRPFHKIEAAAGNFRIELAKPPASAIRTGTAKPVELAATDPAAVLAAAGGKAEGMPLFLDRLQDTVEAALLEGWAYRTDVGGMEEVEISLVLAAGEKSYLCPCERLARSDVAQAHGAGRLASGWSCPIDKDDLAPGIYEVGVLLRCAGREPLYTALGRRLEVAH